MNKAAVLYKPVYFVTFLLSVSLAPSRASAECSCPPKPDIKPAFDDASFIFIGRVETLGESPLRKGEMEAKFSVLKRFKNPDEPLGSQVLVYTNKNADDCGYNFSIGQDYLVYAEGTAAHLKTSACARTEYLDNALEEVDKLITYAPPVAPTQTAPPVAP